MVKILIVEDDSFLAEVLAGVLELEGHDVTVAYGAAEGVRRGADVRPDLVITAWRLKGVLHGGAVCERICSISPPTRVIVITSLQERVAEASRYCRCIQTVLVKPFHKSELLDAVRQALAEGGPAEPLLSTVGCRCHPLHAIAEPTQKAEGLALRCGVWSPEPGAVAGVS